MYIFAYKMATADPEICHKAWQPAFAFAKAAGLVDPEAIMSECGARLIGTRNDGQYHVDFVRLDNPLPLPDMVLVALCGIVEIDDVNEMIVQRIASHQIICHLTAATASEHLESVMAAQFELNGPADIGGVSTYVCDGVPVVILQLKNCYQRNKEYADAITSNIRRNFTVVN